MPGGTNQAISVYPNGNTDLIIDIDGYFAPSNSGQDPLSLYTLPPCRVLDTRHGGSGTFSGLLPVAVLASSCNVPSAQAYVLNATVIPYQGHSMGYLSLWPDAEGQPLVSTLNAADGALTSNMAIVPTLNGSIDTFAQNPTDMILDIFSYFAPITPLEITTTSLPSGALTFPYNVNLGASGGVPPYTWSLTSGVLPTGLNPLSASGAITGTPTVTGTYPFTVQVVDSQTPPATKSAPLSITVNATLAQLTVVTTSLPNGTQNTGYNAMLAADGGVTPYTWSIIAGNLPRGLSLNTNTGAIIGTPSGGGTSNFTVQVTDSNSPPANASAPLSITVIAAVPLSITTTSLPAGMTGTAYSANLTAIGGVSPYTWSMASGSLPPGLQLNQTTGAIFGTPTTAGTSNFTVQVADSETPPAIIVSGPLSIVISPSGGGNPGLLSGHYAFYLNGFNSSGAWTLAGSFISDGNGTITSGFVDANSVTGQPYNVPSVTGSYFISSTGLNTITLQGQSYGPVTLAFVLDSAGNGRIIEYDDTTGQGSRGSGVLRKANPSAFSLNALNGNWVFGSTGANYAGTRTVVVAEFTLAAGNITNGTCDNNEGGTYSTCTFTGTMSAIDPQSGRGTGTMHVNGENTPQVFYVVSTGEVLVEQALSQHPMAGSVLQQSGTFNNGSLNGTAVLYMQEIHESDGLDRSQAGIISFDGNGNYNITAFDDDLAGTITQDPPSQGTYTVQSNGAVGLSQAGKNPIPGFLVGNNKAMFVDSGSSPNFGIMEPQTGGPFSNASIAGTYTAGSLAPLDYANARNEVDAGSADGAGNVTANEDSSSHKGLGQNLGQLHGYTIAANGRGTSSDNPPAIFYVISPGKFIVLLPDTDAEGLVFEH